MSEQAIIKAVAVAMETAQKDTGNPVLNLILGLGVVAIIAFSAVFVILKVKGVKQQDGPADDRGKYMELKVSNDKTAEAVDKLSQEVKELEVKVDVNYQALSSKIDKIYDMLFTIEQNKVT